MRKRVIKPVQKQNVYSDQNWLDLEKLAMVEVTSEDDSYPIENALLPDKALGWRASGLGEQTIRLIFDSPQEIQWIRLDFKESDFERTQEYVLRYSSDGDQSYQEIIRQQWNFSPEGATNEIEDYQVGLPVVTALELIINPDISAQLVVATLEQLRLA